MGILSAHELTSLPNECEAADSHKDAWHIRVTAPDSSAARASSHCSQSCRDLGALSELSGSSGAWWPITDFLRESSK